MPLFGSKTDISMDLTSAHVVAGETIPVTIDLGEPDKKSRSARLELVYRNTYKEDDTDYDSDGGSSRRTVTRRTDVVAAVVPLFDGGTPQAGRQEVEIAVPHDAPGTASGSVEWRLRAVVDRKMGNDAEAEQDIMVLSNPDALRSWSESSCPPSERVRMMLDASPRLVRPGETITGTLRIAPLEEVSGRGVRVQLRRVRRDPDRNVDEDEYAVVQLTGEGSMPAGSDETLPFSLEVPSGVPPSFRAQHNEQHWYLEGVIDVARALDPVVRLEVVVSTG